MAIRHFLGRVRFNFQREPQWAEFASGLAIIGWAALAYMSPLDPAFAPVWWAAFVVADDRWWQAKGAMLGALQLLALYMDWRWARWVVAMLLAWVWFFLAASITLDWPPARGVALYVVFALINLLCVFRVLQRPAGRRADDR